MQQEIKGDERAERLFQLLTDVDMDYNPVYPESRNRDLVLMGYGSEEIREMRDRLAGLEVNDGIDPETSVGYQLYKRGQELTGAAQSGLTEGSRAVQGAVSSAAENLAISSINPAAVLPVLSLQGAGDAMGQSIEKGESAGKTLAGGALKFGAGWGINSVGAADLAKTMGSDYAKDTLAGQIAAKIQSLVGDAPFAKAHPTVAAALSGGIDNAMQAFVESYADKAIDAALGDEKAAQSLFTTDTLIAALESGLSGGASGAMGGAVGSVLAKHNDGNASLLGQAEYYDQLDKYEKAVAAEKKRQQRVEEPGMASEQQTAQEAAKADSGLALSGASRQLPQSGSPWQDGEAKLDEKGSAGRESDSPADKGGGSENGEGEAGEEAKKPSPAERRRAFGQMMSGEYKDLADEMMQIAAQNLEASPEMRGLLEAIAEKYGTDATDLTALTDAIRNGVVKDDAYFEKIAMEKGISVKTAREMDKLETQNKRLTAQQQAAQQMQKAAAERARIAQIQAKWDAEAEALKAKYPEFDREEVLANPEVEKMMRAGCSMEAAYRAAYFDRLMARQTAATAQQTEQGVLNRVQQRASRPAENGTRPGGAVQTHLDVEHMSRKDREALERRVLRGEIITL